MKTRPEYRSLMLHVNAAQLKGGSLEKIAGIIRDYAQTDAHVERVAFLNEFVAELERRIGARNENA